MPEKEQKPVGESAPPAQPATALKQHKFVDIDNLGPVVFVPLTSREYVLAQMNDDQAAQLLEMGWPHIAKK